MRGCWWITDFEFGGLGVRGLWELYMMIIGDLKIMVGWKRLLEDGMQEGWISKGGGWSDGFEWIYAVMVRDSAFVGILTGEYVLNCHIYVGVRFEFCGTGYHQMTKARRCFGLASRLHQTVEVQPSIKFQYMALDTRPKFTAHESKPYTKPPPPQPVPTNSIANRAYQTPSPPFNRVANPSLEPTLSISQLSRNPIIAK